mmetsp:Transcript_20779/g.35680  ORF Transcript_20779/g.35680 Transcript_20779/m.35680 type:complete len:340 (-) Transcript_20779:11876-12895(-)
MADLLHAFLDVVLVPGLGHLLEQVVGQDHHLLLPGQPAPAARLARLDVQDGAQHRGRVPQAVRDVGVGVQPEDLGGVDLRHVLRDELPVLQDLVKARDLVPGAELEIGGQDAGRDEDFGEGGEQDAVLVVGDTAAVLDLGDHVAARVVGHGGPLLGVVPEHRQVVLHELHGGAPVPEIVLVRDAPPDGAELAPLLHDRVQVRNGVEHRLPLDAAEVVKEVLRHPRVRPQEPCSHALRRLIGQLDGHLQQPNGEGLRGLCRDPEAELLVDVRRVLLDQHLQQLPQERQPQVAVLGQGPVPCGKPVLHEGMGRGLLPLPHTNGTDLLLPLLGQTFNLPRGV